MGRYERDMLGEREITEEALHGIATARALENFGIAGRPVHRGLVRAYGAVKLAASRTNHELGYLGEPKWRAIEAACLEMMRGALDEHVVVDAFQGGAGTSTNMNVNEVLANRALELCGRQPGEYEFIDPTGDLNRHQSTNDTYPTALRVAAILLFRRLEGELTGLVEAFQRKEREFADVVKPGRTQLQEAVLVTLGREFGAYAEAFSRDRWRVSKCEERLRVVNLGGTAVGTGLGAPREYIFRVVENLRAITGLGLARAENLIDATMNLDPFVEASGMLRALAGNLIKVGNDLRLLASGPDAGIGEIRLPAVQVGSSIMPGKINPVIPEAVIQAGLVVAGHDQVVYQACSMGNLELNHLMPVIAESLLESLDVLSRACRLLADRCVNGIEARRERCRRLVEGSVATATALVERLGYHGAEDAALVAREKGISLRQQVVGGGLLSEAEFDELVAVENVTRLGSVPKVGFMPA